MYKIYINEQALILCNSSDLDSAKESFSPDAHLLCSLYQKKPHHLLAHIDMMEKIKKYDGVIIYARNEEKLFDDFKSLFKYIKAGGGVVRNNEGKILMIYRRGAWDLPKGKAEKGETKKETASREVEEETGITVDSIGHRLINTYHTYKQGGRRILKKSYWFEMTTKDKRLTPQKEEDIALAEWKSKEECKALYDNAYQNIIDVLEDYWTKKED